MIRVSTVMQKFLTDMFVEHMRIREVNEITHKEVIEMLEGCHPNSPEPNSFIYPVDVMELNCILSREGVIASTKFPKANLFLVEREYVGDDYGVYAF